MVLILKILREEKYTEVGKADQLAREKEESVKHASQIRSLFLEYLILPFR